MNYYSICLDIILIINTYELKISHFLCGDGIPSEWMSSIFWGHKWLNFSLYLPIRSSHESRSCHCVQRVAQNLNEKYLLNCLSFHSNTIKRWTDIIDMAIIWLSVIYSTRMNTKDIYCILNTISVKVMTQLQIKLTFRKLFECRLTLP